MSTILYLLLGRQFVKKLYVAVVTKSGWVFVCASFRIQKTHAQYGSCLRSNTNQFYDYRIRFFIKLWYP